MCLAMRCASYPTTPARTTNRESKGNNSMAHVAYAPVGYDFNADSYCLNCIPTVIYQRGRGHGGTGTRPNGECNCTECRLDRIAIARGIDRYDERSFDSGDFPKHISYHNDGHSECGPDGGYDDDDPDWAWTIDRQFCNMRCGKCGDVIDGVSQLDGPDICPVYANHERSKA
jgi:hypothetical protein